MKNKYLSLFTICILLLSACSTTEQVVQVVVRGCTDTIATNYSSDAEQDDGSCRYDEVVSEYFCTINDLAQLTVGMSKHDVIAILDIYPFDILSSSDGCEIHVYHARYAAQELLLENHENNQVNNNGERKYREGVKVYQLFYKANKLTTILSDYSQTDLPHQIVCFTNNLPSLCSSNDDYVICTGCKDQLAINYDSSAEEDDGTCEYYIGCTDPAASNYDRAALYDDGSCEFIGCTDPEAINYNPSSRHKQSTCEYCPCDTEEYYYVKSSNTRCVSPCVKVMRQQQADGSAEKSECDWCDLLNNTGNAEVKIKIEGAKVGDK